MINDFQLYFFLSTHNFVQQSFKEVKLFYDRKPLVVTVNSVRVFKGIKIYFRDELKENESYMNKSRVVIEEHITVLFSIC